MSFSLDTIVNALKNTFLHPIALVGYIAYRAFDANGWPIRDGLLTTAYVILTLRGGRWLSNRWRNGLIPLKRLDSSTWPEELALVTGGAQGIGKATSELLARKGCQVAAVDIVDFTPSDANIRAYKVDISDYEALERLRGTIRKDFGKDVTIVANIAGINNKACITELTKKTINSMLDVNLKSHFYTASLFLPSMIRAKRGHYLSISSTMGLAGICRQSDYVAAKHGLVGMNESLYYEMQKVYQTPNVRTSIAIIGHTKTGLFDTFDVGAVGRFLGPSLEPEHVAREVVDAFEAQETRIILTPFLNNTAPILKALPSFVRDLLQDASGADKAYAKLPVPKNF